MSEPQVYWRIRRADGKYWSDYGWREIWLASAYSKRPSTEDLDPTARVVRVRVVRKEKRK